VKTLVETLVKKKLGQKNEGELMVKIFSF